MDEPKLVKMPETKPVGKEQRHDFTPAQLETINEQLKIRAEAERFISMFMDYVRREAKLADATWGLGVDEKGTPYMKATAQEKT